MRLNLLLSATLLIVLGCSHSPASDSVSGCPEKPQLSLKSEKVKSISLNEKTIVESGIASQSQSIGYSFEAREGQRFSYQTDENLCIWIYTPDNQVLTSGVLPITGKYTVQVSALRGSTTFQLEMKLATAEAPVISASGENNQPVNRDRPSRSPPPIQQLSQPQTLGWIWIGAVNNTSGVFTYGESLIPTKRQPVAITPAVVPVPNSVVTITTEVNVRGNLPQPPNFKLAEKVTAPLKTGQKITIVRIEAFVDSNSDIPLTRIWAEVARVR